MKYVTADLAKALYLAARAQTEKDAGKTLARFMEFLKRKRLLHHLPKLVRQLPAIAARIDDAEALHIETARPLSEHELATAIKAAGLDPDMARVKVTIDPELLGGVRMRRKGKVLDLTVRGKLRKLRATLSKLQAPGSKL